MEIDHKPSYNSYDIENIRNQICLNFRENVENYEHALLQYLRQSDGNKLFESKSKIDRIKVEYEALLNENQNLKKENIILKTKLEVSETVKTSSEKKIEQLTAENVVLQNFCDELLTKLEKN